MTKEADRLLKQGILQYQTRQFETALQSWQTALSLYTTQDLRQQGAALGNLGAGYQALGNYSKAIECYQQHLNVAQQIQDHKGEANALLNLGNAYYTVGDIPKAIEYHQQMAIIQASQDSQAEGQTLYNLGAAYYALEDHSRAIAYFEQYLVIASKFTESEPALHVQRPWRLDTGAQVPAAAVGHGAGTVVIMTGAGLRDADLSEVDIRGTESAICRLKPRQSQWCKSRKCST